MRFPYNLHIHSNQSRCARAEMTLENIIREALEIGFDFIGIADHVHDSNEPIDFLLTTKAQLAVLRQQVTLPVLNGCEVTQLTPTHFALADEIAAQLDFVMVAPNHYHIHGVEQPSEFIPQVYARHHLDLLEGAILWEHTDIIAHPFFPKLKRELRTKFEFTEYTAAIDRQRLRALLALAVEKKVAFEVNPMYYFALPEFYQEFIEMAQAIGTRLAPGTDAHRLDFIDFNRFYLFLKNNNVGIELLGLREEDLFWPAVIKPC